MIGDVRVIVWREYRDFRRQIVGHLGLFLLFTCLAGILAPNSYLRSQASSGPGIQVLDWTTLISAFFYAGMISELSFFEERSSGTMQTLLTTSIRPMAVFFGKWMWMMTQTTTLILVIYVCHRLVEVGYSIAGWSVPQLTVEDLAWSALVAFFAWTLCSFIVAANAGLSLVAPKSPLGRIAAMCFLSVPMLGAYGFHKLFAVEWDRRMIWLVGLLCMALSLVSFLVACLIFRLERVRL